MLHLIPTLASLKRLASAVSIVSEVKILLFGDAPHRKNVVKPEQDFTNTQQILIKAEYGRYVRNKGHHRARYKNLDQLVVGLNARFGLSKSKYAYSKVWKNQESHEKP